MEPIINKEGLKVMQDSAKSRTLLSDYYTRLGYNVVSATRKAFEKRHIAQQLAVSPISAGKSSK